MKNCIQGSRKVSKKPQKIHLWMTPYKEGKTHMDMKAKMCTK